MKCTNIKTIFHSMHEDLSQQKEASYEQRITGIVLNGPFKGKTVSFTNIYSSSESASRRFQIDEKLFVTLSQTPEHSLKITVLYEKRDSYLFLLTGIFILLLLIVSRKQGFFILLSLFINTIVFFLCLKFYNTTAFLSIILVSGIFFFSITALLLVSGIHRKTFGAILSTIVSVLIVSLLYFFLVYKNQFLSYRYDELPVKAANLPLDQIIFISSIFGLLGAVMDIAITINSSVSGLVLASTSLSLKSLINSIFEIGHDIMGTMVNVLFFSYMNSSLPLIVLKISKYYSISTILRVDCLYDIIRFLVGAIGIVLSIPISGIISILVFRKELWLKK